MTSADGSPRASGPVSPRRIVAWLEELGITAGERADRDGVSSWDVSLDGRLRAAIPITLILDPAFALLCWVHYAPPINESFPFRPQANRAIDAYGRFSAAAHDRRSGRAADSRRSLAVAPSRCARDLRQICRLF